MTEPSRFSELIVYVDESGDHNLVQIDENYPIFVLAFCVFYKRHYIGHVVSEIQRFKFRHFGHDIVVLHERDIRKEIGDFNIFRSIEAHRAFMKELSGIVDDSNFILIACVIDKKALRARGGGASDNAYDIALKCGLEQLFGFVEEKSQIDRETHVVFERRGKKEDTELELEFRRICDGANSFRKSFPFSLKFASKQINSSGLQLSDLVARPIGMHVLKPEQKNRAFEILEKKFYCAGGRAHVGERYEGIGLKCIPETRAPESEKPR